MNFSNISNKLYDENDILRIGSDPGPILNFKQAYNRCENIHKELLERGGSVGKHRADNWENGIFVESTNPGSGDNVLFVEGYHQPNSFLPFYLSELGCNVSVIHNIHEFWYPWISPEEYDSAGINRIEATDWYNIPKYCSDLDAIYCSRELEHTNPNGLRYLSENNYDEVISMARSTIDLWLSVSDCVSCTHNLFGTNFHHEKWGEKRPSYTHPFTSLRLQELLSYYSVEVDYEDFSNNKYGENINNWSDYYRHNMPRESTEDFPVELCYTVASFTITK